jgi:putative amide transporter protein
VNGIWLLGQARAAEAAPQPAEAVGAGPAAPAAIAVEAHPSFMQGREIAVMNLFTGFVGVAVSVTLLVQAASNEDLASARGAGYILLFAFTYLWVAYNQYVNAGSHAFGWYCLFVAITAVPAGIFTFANADGSDASIYLGVCWFAWAVLWFLFWLLLAMERPITKLTGWLAILEGIGTSWVFAILLLQEELAF